MKLAKICDRIEQLTSREFLLELNSEEIKILKDSVYDIMEKILEENSIWVNENEGKLLSLGDYIYNSKKINYGKIIEFFKVFLNQLKIKNYFY